MFNNMLWKLSSTSLLMLAEYSLMCLLFVSYIPACHADLASADAFKSILSSSKLIREISWSESKCDKPNDISYYTGATDGTNFYIRGFLPSEDLTVPLSPTNRLGFPYFVGCVDHTNWEITGTLMINETSMTNNPIFSIAQNGRIILARGLAFGLPNAKDGAFSWNGNSFSVPRFGLIPEHVTIRHIKMPTNSPTGTLHVKHNEMAQLLQSLTNLTQESGVILLTNGVVGEMDCGLDSIHYEYSDSNLPVGVPSTIFESAGGQPKEKCFMKMQILRFKLDTNLDEMMFQPTTFIAPGYYGITQVYSNESQVVLNNAYNYSRQRAEETSKAKRYTLLILFGVLACLPLFVVFRKIVFRHKPN